MSERNYWQRLRRNRMTRRSLLRASARAGVGATGLALVGCGGDDDEQQQAVAQAQQQQQQVMQPQQDQQQQQQEQAEQQAERQAMQQEQQEQQAEAQPMQQEQQQATPQPAAGETDFNATVRIAVDTATGGLDPIRAGGVATLPHYDTLGQFDQFSKEFVQSAATFE